MVDNQADPQNEGRESNFNDIDRMVNEGLGGGRVLRQNGLIEEAVSDTLDDRESVFDDQSI